MSARQYGTIGIVGVSAFLLVNVALHFLDPDLSVVDAVLSDYALGDYGWLSRAWRFRGSGGPGSRSLWTRSTLAPGKRVAASWVLILLAGFDSLSRGCLIQTGQKPPSSQRRGFSTSSEVWWQSSA